MTDKELTVAQELLEAYSSQNRKKRERFAQIGNQLLQEAGELQRQRKEKNKAESFEFNIFDLMGWPNENLHSRLLAFLLNPYESHGQGNLFLKSFLRKLDVEEPNSHNWAVTAEKGRIDILLVRQHPHSVIIIENKSNGAVDQPSQLYRYWYYQIHSRKRIIGYSEGGNLKNYQILYLTANSYKVPADGSLCKPDSFQQLEEFMHLPDRVPIVPEKWQFSEIANILEEILKENLKDNHRLRTYLEQYLELIKSLS